MADADMSEKTVSKTRLLTIKLSMQFPRQAVLASASPATCPFSRTQPQMHKRIIVVVLVIVTVNRSGSTSSSTSSSMSWSISECMNARPPYVAHVTHKSRQEARSFFRRFEVVLPRLNASCSCVES